MSKRQNCNNQDEDGGLGDSHVAPATKQIRLENAHLDQQYQGKEEQPQQAISNGQKRMSKDMRETPTTIKARRRSTGNKWWGFPARAAVGRGDAQRSAADTSSISSSIKCYE